MERKVYLQSIMEKDFWSNISKTETKFRNHPIFDIYNKTDGILSNNIIEFSKNYSQKIVDAIKYAEDNHTKWFKEKLERMHLLNDRFTNAFGAIAEINCLYELTTSGFEVTPIIEKENQPTPDFSVVDYNDNQFYVEVFCPTIKNSVKNKLENFYKERVPSGKVKIITYYPLTDEVRSENDVIKNIRNRFLSNKGKGTQTQNNETNILWIDFETSNLNLDKNNLNPITSKQAKGDYITGNFGIWNAFYGKKNMKLFTERTKLRIYDYMSPYEELKEDGYFRTNDKWSGVIVNLENSTTIYQNPWASRLLSKSIIRNLFRLRKFDLCTSWADHDNDELINRIESKINQINRVHEMLLDHKV